MGRRGPRQSAGAREPNGRLSRKADEKAHREAVNIGQDEWDAMYVALLARWRVHGVPLSEVRNQMAGSFLGRLCLAGEITTTQYDAAQSYLAQRRDYHLATGAPKADATAVNLNAVHGRNNAEDPERDERTEAEWRITRMAIAAKQLEEGMQANLWAAVDLCVHRDVELEHMVPDLRSALNALVKRFGIGAREAA